MTRRIILAALLVALPFFALRSAPAMERESFEGSSPARHCGAFLRQREEGADSGISIHQQCGMELTREMLPRREAGEAPQCLAGFDVFVDKSVPVPASRPAGPAYAVTRTWPVGGDFGWSSMALDPQRKLLYVSRNNQTQVIDIATGKVVAEISHINGAHTIVLVPDSNRGFIGNVKDGSVTVFDLNTHGVLGTLFIAPSLGSMIYDPASKRLLAVCPFTQSIIPFPADIDLKIGKTDPPIPLHGKIGTLVADGRGMVYVPEMDSDDVAVLDTRIMKIATTWRLGLRDRPTDISLDPLHSRLFIVCHTRLLALSATDGHELATFPLPVGMQTTTYFAGQVFIADPEGPVIAIGQSASGQFEIQQTITAAPGAKILAGDAATGELFVPMAEFLGPKGRRPAPGTFKILVLQKK